jgi:hypothetical protein
LNMMEARDPAKARTIDARIMDITLPNKDL